MLRGPQTVGELRGRTERMHEFTDLEEVEHCLETLAQRDAGAAGCVDASRALVSSAGRRAGAGTSKRPCSRTCLESATGQALEERVAALEPKSPS